MAYDFDAQFFSDDLFPKQPEMPTDGFGYDSPFKENSVFNDNTPKYVPFVNFKKLIPAIRNSQGKLMEYYYKIYESKATIPVSFLYPGVFFEKTEDEDELPDGDHNEWLDIITDSMRQRVDKEFVDDSNGKIAFLDGKLNEKRGFIRIDKAHIGFSFTLDGEKRLIRFADSFHYTDRKTGQPQTERAIIIETPFYESYKVLSKAEGLYLTESSISTIIRQFEQELARASDKPNTMDWLYKFMPDFVLQQRSKHNLINDLSTILTGDINRTGQDYINEEVIVYRILSAFVTDKTEDQDYLLEQLTSKIVNDKTLFQLLYEKISGAFRSDSFSATIKLLYKIWCASKYAKPENHVYKGQPETFAYTGNKILGFYANNFKFEFEKNRIIAKEIVETRNFADEENPFSTTVEYEFRATYGFFQPVRLPEVDQAGELKLPDIVIPAFYLKAFDDKNAWDNFEKAAWLVFDIATTALGFANLLKLRHLAHLPNAIYRLRLATSIIEVTNGIAGTMLNFVNGCQGDGFCEKLRKYLFWLDLATLGVDAITARMLSRTATEALDAMPERVRREHPDIAAHLDEMSVSGRGRRSGQRLTKSEVNEIEHFLKDFKCELEFFPETGVYEIKGYFTKSGQPASFPEEAAAMLITDGRNLKMILRENATIYEFFHELMHLRHAKKMGLKLYYKLGGKGTSGELIKEQYVFDKMVEYREFFTRDELTHAWEYLNNTIYSRYGKEPIPFDFDINQIPVVRKEISIQTVLNKK